MGGGAPIDAVKYAEYIIEKARYLQRCLRFCSSSDMMYSYYLYLEEIVYAAERIKELVKEKA